MNTLTVLKKTGLVFVALFFIFGFDHTGSLSPGPTLYNGGLPHVYPGHGQNNCVADQVVVKLSLQEDRQLDVEGLGRNRAGDYRSPAAGNILLSRYRWEIKDITWDHHCGYLVVKTWPGCDLEVLKKRLLREPLVLDVSPNYIAAIAVQPPDDPFFDYQYALHNSGQVYLPELGLSGSSGSDIRALEGWDWTTGTGEVVIAVLDTGVASDHEDLMNQLVPGYNFVHDSADTYDDHGHGTFVASVAAAQTNNGIGMAGVSWNAKIMPLKVADSEGIASYLAIAAAMRFAADNGARVINLSLGGINPSFILEEASKYAFDRGCLIVAASGNQGARVLYPAAYDDYCLAVGASDAHDQIAPWTNVGPEVDVVAPGVFVFGAVFLPASPEELNHYGWASGTSFATPYVSGVAALVLGYKPFLANDVVMRLIKFTADDVNQASHPGVDDYAGYGRINLSRLLGPYELD